jgi:hypothetical protein
MSMLYFLYIINMTLKINFIDIKKLIIILFYVTPFKTIYKKSLLYYRYIRRFYINKWITNIIKNMGVLTLYLFIKKFLTKWKLKWS